MRAYLPRVSSRYVPDNPFLVYEIVHPCCLSLEVLLTHHTSQAESYIGGLHQNWDTECHPNKHKSYRNQTHSCCIVLYNTYMNVLSLIFFMSNPHHLFASAGIEYPRVMKSICFSALIFFDENRLLRL